MDGLFLRSLLREGGVRNNGRYRTKGEEKKKKKILSKDRYTRRRGTEGKKKLETGLYIGDPKGVRRTDESRKKLMGKYVRGEGRVWGGGRETNKGTVQFLRRYS